MENKNDQEHYFIIELSLRRSFSAPTDFTTTYTCYNDTVDT